MAEVEVIRAADGPVVRRRDIEGKGVRLDRIRVAVYVRVSTDGEIMGYFRQGQTSEGREVTLQL